MFLSETNNGTYHKWRNLSFFNVYCNSDSKIFIVTWKGRNKGKLNTFLGSWSYKFSIITIEVLFL